MIFALFVAHDFERTVSDNLIDIHVNRSSGTTLNHVYREILMPLTLNDFAASLRHSSCNLVIDYTEGMVCLCGSHLH